MLKKLLVGVLILAIAGGGIYWYVATDTFSDTKGRKAAYKVSASELIREFLANDSAANKKYAEEIVSVSGRVSEVESVDTTLNVKFTDPVSGSYIIFAFQKADQAEARSIAAGDSVSIKGSCSGSIYSEILEVTAISFKRSTINKRITNKKD